MSVPLMHPHALMFGSRPTPHASSELLVGLGKHVEYNDVGQNTVELWTLESGGNWIHPVHVHLIVSAPAS